LGNSVGFLPSSQPSTFELLVGTVAADAFRRILVDEMTSRIKANDGVTRTGRAHFIYRREYLCQEAAGLY
jgi:hypothetical protein